MRSTSGILSSSSNCRICWDSAGCETKSRSAARRKLRSSATAWKYCNCKCRSSVDDLRYLLQAGEALRAQVEDLLDLWYGFVASHPRRVYYFTRPDGTPDQAYLATVRRDFGQWVLDSCTRPYDQQWLASQYEIGLRHHRTKKNHTNGV